MASFDRIKNTGLLQFQTGTSETGNPILATTNVNNIVPESLTEGDYDTLRQIFQDLMKFRNNQEHAIYMSQTDGIQN